MTTLKKLLFTCCLLWLSGNAFAAHIVGGGITYECLGNSGNGIRYRFTMKVYRDCASGGAQLDDPANIAIYRGTYQSNLFVSTFEVPLQSSDPITIIEPDCIDNLPFLCIQEGIYTWERVLPLSNESYFIEYQRCCRTNAITNIFDPANTGATYFIEITPAAQQICNNSPVFNNFPPVVICNNYPLEVDYSATDPDGDQLVYSFCAPFAGGGNTGSLGGCFGVAPDPPCPPPFDEVIFLDPTYTATQPMGGNPIVSIDPQTGVISGTPLLNGQFVVGVCVEEYRNGQLLSVTHRDFQFNVTDCAPQVTALVKYDELASPKHYVIKECSNSTNLTILNQSLPATNITSFEWFFDLNNGNFIQNTTDFNLTINFPDFGIYNGLLVLNGGEDCGDTAFIQVQLFPPASLDLGPDFTICQDSTILLDAGDDFASFLWQNGTTAQVFSATTTGTYYVAATDHCGNILLDSVFITLGSAPTIQLSNASICPGGSVTLSAPGFEEYEWSPGAGLSCTNCPSVTAQPLVSTTYNVLATTQSGCTSTATVVIEVLPTPMQTYTIQFYPNQPVTIAGQTYTQSTNFTIPVASTTGGCDSLNTYILELIPTAITLSCPANMTVALPNNSNSTAVSYSLPTANTNCPDPSPDIQLIQGLASGANFPAGLNTVCYSATDECGDVDECCFTVMVTSLELTCPPNMTVAMPNNANTVTVSYPMPSATTDCPGSVPAIQLTQGLASGANFPAGLNTVCYGASNTCGNQDNCCFTVMVSTLDIQCPPNQTVELPVAATTVVVNYVAPTSNTNCPNPAVSLSLQQGLASGSGFPLGVNNVCYAGSTTCGNQDNCCFQVTVLDAPPACDIKIIGCMKFELLDIRLDSIKQPRFRIRVTNFCTSEVNYILNELPPGVVAVTPVEGSIYTAVNTANTYLIRNPNYSPFYSVRYKAISPGLKNGQADVLEHRLPQQSFPNNYIHMFAKLKDGQSFEAYLNTFYCPVQPWAGSKLQEESGDIESLLNSPAISLHPNPSAGLVMVDMQAWQGQDVQLRLINTLGQEVLSQAYSIESEWLELNLDQRLTNGLYYLIVQPKGGAKASAVFLLER